MRYFPPRHNLTSRITASLLIILYILTLGPLKEALAFVIPQNLLPAPILSSQITKFSSISGKYDQLCRYNPTAKKFEYFVLDNPEYTKWTTLEPAKGYRVKVSDALANLIKGTNYDRISKYDKAGNLKTQTDAKGQIVSFDYDALDRLTKILGNSGKFWEILKFWGQLP